MKKLLLLLAAASVLSLSACATDGWYGDRGHGRNDRHHDRNHDHDRGHHHDRGHNRY